MSQTPTLLLTGAFLVTCALASAASTPPDLSKGGKIHLAAIQTTALPGDLSKNQANVEKLIREAAGRGARYILLPEYYPGLLINKVGMTLEEVRSRSQTVDGPLARHLLRLCKKLDVYIGFPLAERRADGKVYNSTIYAGPKGIEGVYSKIVLINILPGRKHDPKHPSEWQEDEIFTRGTSDGVFTWGGVRIGALICADGGFPNLFQARMAKGVQMFCHPEANAGFHKGESYPEPEVAAALYHRPVVLANHWIDHFYFQGNTRICDATGKILAKAGRQPNVVIDAILEIPPVPEAEPATRD